jgi:DNA primase
MAALRALDIFLENGVNVKIVELPKGFDPDSLVRAQGKDGFQKILSQKTDFFDYKSKTLMRTHDLKTINGKSEFAVKMLLTIDKISGQVERSEYIKRLASLLKTKEEVLLLELGKMHKPSWGKKQIAKSILSSPIPLTEKMIIKFMLNDKDAAFAIRDSLNEEYFTHPLTKKAVSCIFSDILKNDLPVSAQISGTIHDHEVSRFLSGLLLEEGPPLTEELLNSCVEKLKGKRHKMLNAFLTQKIGEAELKRDEEILKELMKKKMHGEVEHYGETKTIES